MTLLEKLLRRQNSTNRYGGMRFKSYLSSSRNSEGRFVLEKNEVRLIIFKDHDKFGRKLLYDSHACELKDSTDEHLLGELLFGNKVMVRKVNSAIKVHILMDPPQFFIAKVFIPSTSACSEVEDQRTCGSFDWYCFHDLPQSDLASSKSLPIPFRDDLIQSYDASNVGSEPSYQASLSRWWTLRNRGPSDMVLTSSLALTNTVGCNKSHKTQEQDLSDCCITQPLPLNQRPVKLGIGITFLIPENEFAAEFMRKFFFSHMNILEGYILKIKNILESPEFLEKFKSCKAEKMHSFFQEMTQGTMNGLLNFYSFPRIQNPVWLSLSLSSVMSSSSFDFMREFVFLSEKCYTRNTKFFLGSLLTAVLTHHLSWVLSMPRTCNFDGSYLSKATVSEGQPLTNPLVTQLRDLCGAVGFPCCISKTVVVGKRVDLVKKFIFILSYFIRCNDLSEILEMDENFTTKERSHVSCATDGEIFKDSGFSESSMDEKNSLPNKFKRPDVTSNPTSENVFSYISKTSDYHSKPTHSSIYLEDEVKLTNDDKFSFSSEQNALNVQEQDSLEYVSKDFLKNEEYLSILPVPAKVLRTPYIVCQTQSAADDSTMKREVLPLQKTAPYESEIGGGGLAHAAQQFKFNVEELLYEIMEDCHGNEPEAMTATSDDSSESRGKKSDLFCSPNVCTLDVNEPSCLPDGPLKEQLLFKLDLIGTHSTAFDVSSEPQVNLSQESSLRNSRILKLENMPLPELEEKGDDDDDDEEEEDGGHEYQHLPLEESNLGRSLFGDFCRNFTPEFVLHGTSDRTFLSPPFNDLHQDLKISLKNPVFNEPADAALFIVADLDNWNVQLFSLKSLSPDESLTPQPITSSQLVLRLIESSFELSKFNSSPDIWLNLIEDQLNNIYMKSKILAEFIQVHGQFCSQQLARLLGYDVSDLPLLLAVAGIHSPKILPNLTNSQKHA